MTKQLKAHFAPDAWEAKLKKVRAQRRTAKGIAATKKYRARSDVKERRRRTNRESQRRSYGFTPGMFEVLLIIQDHKCGVCKKEIDDNAHADHCHDARQPRGLLCRNCNVAEGYIKRTGMSARDFGEQLQAYLDNPPAEIAKLA